MIKNKIIWIDLDEVLAELFDYVLKYNNYRIWNILLNKESISDYYIYKIPWVNITQEEAVEWFKRGMINDENELNVIPVFWAKEKLVSLKNNGYKIFIVTARYNEIKKYTINWVEKYYPNIFNDIIFAEHFTENSRKKSDICLETGITTFIEDNYEYALDIANVWIKTLLLDKPWNDKIEIQHPKIERLLSWNDFNESIIL